MDQQEKSKILENIDTFSLMDHFQKGCQTQKNPAEQQLQDKAECKMCETAETIENQDANRTAHSLYAKEAREDCDEIIMESNWKDLQFEITERRSNLALNIRGKKIVFDEPIVLADHLREAQSLKIEADPDGRVYMMISWIDENAYLNEGDLTWQS